MPSIPKIIHQLWIGTDPEPTKFMDTWKEKHESEEFEYIRWTESEIKKRGFKTQLRDRINEMEEISGKADILRWELLYEYGGVFVDADSYCIEPVTDLVEKYEAFVSYENENIRGAGWHVEYPNENLDDILAKTHPLLSNCVIGFPPKHEIPRLAIEWIKKNNVSIEETKKQPWRSVGSGLLTKLTWNNKFEEVAILPSYFFLPIHSCGLYYPGHGKRYAHHEWGTTRNSYENIILGDLHPMFNFPSDKVSILISSYNTKKSHLSDCLTSILHQEGNVFMEIIWINDGSNEKNTKILKKMLKDFMQTTQNVKVVYCENNENKGIGYSLNRGVKMCSNEIIMKMDSDDIMAPKRIIQQMFYMKNNPEIAICGGQVVFFKKNVNDGYYATTFKSITWNELKKNPKHNFVNHHRDKSL